MTETVEFITVEERQIGGTWIETDHITASELDLTDGIDTYRPVAWTRDRLASSFNPNVEDLVITLPASDAVATPFLPRFPDLPYRLRLKRATAITRNPTSITADTFETRFVGTVVSASFEGPACKLTLRGPRRLLENPGPTQRFQSQCRWDLYGPGCTVIQSGFETLGNAVVGADPSPLNYTDYVFSSAFGGPSAGYFNGGTLILLGQYARQIASHSIAASPDPPFEPYVRLVAPFPVAVTNGDALRIYPGCDHTAGTCDTKFANVANFGGFPRIGTVNPFRKSMDGGFE